MGGGGRKLGVEPLEGEKHLRRFHRPWCGNGVLMCEDVYFMKMSCVRRRQW